MTRQTQFSKSLQGTAQDLQRVQQIVSSLTDTIRGVAREFTSLLSGVNQAAGGQTSAPASQVASSFLTPRGDQLGRELLGSAQQRLMDDMAKYNQQSADRQRQDADAMRVAQSLRVSELNAVRAGGQSPNFALTEQMYGRGALIRGQFVRSGSQVNSGFDPSAIGYAAQQRLKEGMSVPEVSLLLQQSLNKDQLEAFRSHSGSFGAEGRKISGVQSMLGLPAERIQSRIALDVGRQAERAESTARQQAAETMEKQKSDAHRFLAGGYSSNDRSHSIALAQATGDRGLLYSLGDVRRSVGTNNTDMIEDAASRAARMKFSASGADRATAIEIEKVVDELRGLRKATVDSDKRLHDVIVSGARPGSAEYDKVVGELKRVTDKQTQAAERLKDLTRGGDGGPGGPGSGFDPKKMAKGIVDAMATVAPVVSAGFGMSQGMLQSNIGANRRSINAEADLAQMKFQRFMESSDMTKAENLIKYRADRILPKMEARDLKYMGSEAREKAMSEAQRETLQNLELSQRAAFGSKVSAGFHATMGVASGVTAGATPIGAMGVTQGIAGTMGAISSLEGNQFQQLSQGGLIGGPVGFLSGLSVRRQNLQASENMRAALAATRSETYRNFNELQNAELRNHPALLHSTEAYYRGIEAKLRGSQLVGASRAMSGFEGITGIEDFKRTTSNYKDQSGRISGRLDTDNSLASSRTRALIEAVDNGTYTPDIGMGNMLTKKQAWELNEIVHHRRGGAGGRQSALKIINDANAAQSQSAEELAVPSYAAEVNKLTEGYSGKTAASLRGMSPEEFADYGNRLGTAMGPGYRGGFSRIAGRTLDYTASGLGSFETLLSQRTALNRLTGLADTSRFQDNILGNAVIGGFAGSRLTPQFASSVIGIAEQAGANTTEGIAEKLRDASDFLSFNGKANERSVNQATAGMNQWNAFTSSRGGVIGQMKTAALLKAGIGFGTGLSTISSMSEDAISSWQKQIKDHNITDRTLQDLVNIHGDEKLSTALTSVANQGSIHNRALTAQYSGDKTDKIKKVLSLPPGKERDKLMSELRISAGDVGRDTIGFEGGIIGLRRDMQRISKKENIPVPFDVEKALKDYTVNNKSYDPAKINREIENSKLARGVLGRTSLSASAESVRSRLDKEGEINIGGETLTREKFAQFEKGELNKKDSSAIRKWMDTNAIERERSASSETKDRDYVKGEQKEVDPEAVSKRTSEIIGDLNKSVDSFKLSVMGFSKAVSESTKIISGKLAELKTKGG